MLDLKLLIKRHIIHRIFYFWNLRQTQGFPTSVTEKNVTMLSGYNAMLLNAFCEKGMEGLKEMTPIKMLDGLLSNKRYTHLEEKIKKYLT